ncbi:hypothetical protein P1J78_16020 [Psychromarinibacter sp. C21-152]|uniref:Uncharacterized protein n=1 Tax=Psychromarinibacter sediminicola TaxID=3033385 RepID=A0AAE3NUD3_9RHOB|nr:hypothetical protein [Psychromarinibacter sediminicola]MDF0602247.1 hypothetical protein [Psychromarinibacter sediminicola]
MRRLGPGGLLLLALAAPAAAQEESRFGEAGTWDVLALREGAALAGCAARREIDGREVRMVFDGADWQLALAAAPPGTVTAFGIDDEALPVDAARAGGMTALSLTPAALEAVRNGQLATVTLDGEAVELPLNGTAAAALRVQDCVRLDGVAPDEADLYAVETLTAEETGPMGADCPARSDAASAPDGPPGTVTLVHALPGRDPLQIYWVDPYGRLLPVPEAFGPDRAEVTLDGYVGQSFVVKDLSGACHGAPIRATADGVRRQVR